jgi:type I restriction enzyme R subunit
VGEGMGADDLSADMAIRLEEIIERHKIRDWVRNDDVKALMTNDIEDYLFSVKGRYELPLTLTEIDHILEQVIHIAIQRDHL